jgi:hypothetical protein
MRKSIQIMPIPRVMGKSIQIMSIPTIKSNTGDLDNANFGYSADLPRSL